MKAIVRHLCPFCKAGKPCAQPVARPVHKGWRVTCGHCGATGPRGSSPHKAWVYWNHGSNTDLEPLARRETNQ